MSANHELLRPKDAAKYIGASRSTIYRLSETDPDFPHKIRLTKRCVGFLRSSLDEYLEKKAAG